MRSRAAQKLTQDWLERTRAVGVAPVVGTAASYVWAAGVARLQQNAKWPSLVSKFGPALRAGGGSPKTWQSLLMAQCVHVVKLEWGDSQGHYQATIRNWTARVPDADAFQKAHIAILMCNLDPEEYLETV